MAELEQNELAARPARRTCLSLFEKKHLPGLWAHFIFWSCAAVGLAADLLTKKTVFDFLTHQPDFRFPVIKGFITLVMATNKGAAFGLLEGARVILTAISFIALFVVLCVFLFAGSKNKLLFAVLGLLAAGISGNLFDRLFNSGRVRDFIEVVYWPGLKPWPAFNVADSLLCIAVAVVLIMTLIQRPCEKRAPKHK